MAKITRMIFVRHGESAGNKDGRFYGHTDGELTELGRLQAQKTAEYLKDYKIDAAYASSLRRAYETCVCIAKYHDLEVIPCDDLREVYAGKWENVPFNDIGTLFPEDYDKWMNDFCHSRPTGGESIREVTDRVSAAVWRIARENVGKTVLLTFHATPICTLYYEWLHLPFEAMRRTWVRNASVSVIDYDCENGTVTPEFIDEASFLGDLETTLPKNV